MTAPGGSWAEAHVDVTLNFDDLDRDLIRRLERSSQIAQRAVNRNLDKIAVGAAKTFEKVDKAFDKQMQSMERRSKTAATMIDRNLSKIDANVTMDVKIDDRRARAEVSRAQRTMQAWASSHPVQFDAVVDSRRARAALGTTLRGLQSEASRRRVNVDVDVDRRGIGSRTLGILGGALGAVGGWAKTAGMFLGKWAGIATAATIAAGSLVPVIGALGSGLVALGGAAGVVAVGGLTALGVAAAALKTAFSGVGDAASTMFDPDKAEQFEEAMSKLTPSAQSALRAFQSVGKSYADIVKTPVQETFFSGLGPKIAQLGRLLPSIRDSLVNVAQGFNDGANGALRMINSARGMSMMRSLLADAGTMGSNFGAAITASVPGLLSLGSAATSVLAPMTEGIGGVARRWSESMLQMQQDGTLQEKMQGLLDFARDVGDALAKVGSIIGGVFRAAAAAGDGNALGGITATLTSVAEWVNGPGQAALTSFFSSVTAAMSAIMPIFLQIAGIIGGQVAPMISGLIVQIAPVVSQLVSMIGQGIAALGPAMGPLGDALSAIGTALGPMIPVLGQLIAQIVQVAGPILGALATALGPVIVAIGQGLTQAFAALTPLIGPISQILVLVGQTLAGIVVQALSAVMPLLQVVAQVFAQVFAAIAPLIPVIGELFGKIIAAAAPILATFAQVLGQVGAILADVLTQSLQALMPLFQALGPILEQVGGALGQLAATIGDALLQVIAQLAPMLPMIIDAFVQILTAVLPLVPILIELAVTCLQPIIGLLPSLSQIILTLVPIIVQLAKIFASLVSAIMPVIAIIAQVIGFFVNLLGTILRFAATALAAIVGFVGGIVSGFLEMVASVVETVSGWVSSVLQFFGDLVARGVAFVTDLWDRVATGFSKGVDAAITFVRELPGKIIDALKGAGKWLIDTGKNIIQGLIDGIKSMGSAIVNALVNLLPGPLQGAARSALGLALGGWIPGLAQGGVLAMLGGGEVGPGATTAIKPGGFIVNARQTRKNRGLLRALAPTGRVLSGPGTGTSDSITGMHNGRPVAKVSRGEYYVPPKAARRMMPQLTALNAGQRLARLASGGRIPYGLPAGSSGPVTADWVQALESKFGVKASTYAGHQEGDGKNKGIDWVGSVSSMQRFAEYLLGIKGDLEQVIWMNPETGEQIGVADGQQVGPGTDQPGYYRDDWGGHQDHVHTRQSYAFGDGLSGSAPGIDDTSGLSTGSTSSSSGTPIGSGISSGSGSGSGSGSSWGNSGGGSRANNAVDAKRQGLTPVWVENWPASIGGGGGLSTGSTGAGLSAGSTGSGLSTGSGGSVGPAPTLSASSSKKDVAASIYAKARDRGYSHEEALAIVSTAIQESNLDANAQGGGGAWHGYFQQDSSYANRDDPNGNVDGFLDRLDEKTKADPNSDIWKRIFWLQQRPGESTADAAYGNGRQAYLNEIQSKQGEAKELVGQVPTTPSGNVPVEVQNSGTPSTTGDLAPAPSTTTPTSGQPASASMPYGKARADQYLREQNLGAGLQDIGVAGLKETFGEFGALIGVESFVERGIDEMVAYLRQIAEKDPKAEFKYADVVNFNGGSPDETKQKTTEGMTAVMDTYRQG